MNDICATKMKPAPERVFTHKIVALTLLPAVAALLLAGCVAPIGADRVSTRESYSQVSANSIRATKPSATTISLLHRFDLGETAARRPDEAVRKLHEKAIATGERDVLFALAEMSFLAGNKIRHSVTPWDQRDARDYYLGAAVYSYLYLFGEGPGAPGPFDRRFRDTCDFYNYGLGLAFAADRRCTNATVTMTNGWRQLPVGKVEIRLADSTNNFKLGECEQFLAADLYRVRGMSVRNRQAGIGAPLIGVMPMNKELGIRRSEPATMFLRASGSLASMAGGSNTLALEVYSSLDEPAVTIAGKDVPLEHDLTAYRAYTLNQARIWDVGALQFLAPSEHLKSQLYLQQPYRPGRIPVVAVHGTFSSPVTWAEMANALTADPELRNRYQLWSFMYGSGNPLAVSASELRHALTDMVNKLDPEGKDPALRQMVIIGHSQGGLLTKLTAIKTGDKIWNVMSTKPIAELDISEAEKEKLRHLIYVEPLPFVSRVVFIATPHRGSYRAGGFARQLARRLMTLPANVLDRGKAALTVMKGSDSEKFLRGRMPTSLDSMSPKNPIIRALGEIPVEPPIKAHSIIPVEGTGDYHLGHDGIVKYISAHQSYTESECIVNHFHTCLNHPATVEEVRRILHLHLKELPPSSPPPP